MKRILVILNPCAGTRRGGRALADVLDIFCKNGFLPIVQTTQRPGYGRKLAEAFAGKVDRIVCIGGDGTFNEVVSGVLDSGTDTPIGYIPAGSTNDFAVSLGLSPQLRQAAQDIVRGTPTAFDVGRFGDRYFTYVASFGAFTKASYATGQRAKNTIGHLAYLLSGVASIPSIRSLHAAVVTDSGERLEDDYLFGAVGNSTSLGGVLRLNPKLVDMQDGVLELILIRKPEDAAQLANCVRALLAQDYRSELLVMRKVRSAVFTLPEDADWTLDGEYAQGQGHAEISIVPGAVRIFIPSEAEA